MDAFLNLALFVGVFYLILVFAGRRDRRKAHTARPMEPVANNERVA